MQCTPGVCYLDRPVSLVLLGGKGLTITEEQVKKKKGGKDTALEETFSLCVSLFILV